MSNYVQMRTCLSKHPKVLRIARATGKHRLMIVGAFHYLWSLDVEYGRTEGVDVRIDGYGREQVDEETFPGFAAAVEEAGWATFDEWGCTLYNARKYQEDVRQIREGWKLAKRKERESKRGVSDETSNETSGRTSGRTSDEKSCGSPATDKTIQDKTTQDQNPPTPQGGKGKRREPGESVAIPASINTPDFQAAWSRWLEYRRTVKRTPVSAIAARQQLADCEAAGVEASIEGIKRSIGSDYQALVIPATQYGRTAGSRTAAITATRNANEYAEAPTPLPMFDLAQNACNANGGEGGLNGVHAPPR